MAPLRRIAGSFALALVSCAGVTADAPAQAVARQRLGPSGGSVAARAETPIAGSWIRVPPDALDGETEVALFSAPDQCPNLPQGKVDLSAPVDFLPIAVAFAEPVVLRIALPETHTPMFARHDGPVRSRALAGNAALLAVGDSGWEELPVVRRGDAWLETTVNVLVHGCFVAVAGSDELVFADTDPSRQTVDAL